MRDIFISHAREDRAACERLGHALRGVGLDIAWNDWAEPESKATGETDKDLESSAATIVMWSRSTASSDVVTSQALRAFNSESREGSAQANRYLAVIIDDLRQFDLPAPFNSIETDAWSEWFSAADISFSDANFLRLLARLESLIGRKNLTVIAGAFAARTADFRAQLDARDHALSKAQLDQARLESQLRAQSDDLERHCADLDARQGRIDQLQSDLSRLSAEKSAISAELAEASRVSAEMRETLSQAKDAAASLSSEKAALESELEDARAGLAAGLRQQSQLNVLLKATDDNLASTILQREDLKAALSAAEQKTAKLSTQLSQTARKLADTELTRQTYEKALIDRKQEIDRLEDKSANLSVEIGQLAPRVEQLSRSAASWSNVPWRLIAAGGVAAGATATYGAISLQRSLDSWVTPPPAITAAAPTAAKVRGAPPPLATEPPPPKSDAKLEPDTIQPSFEETGARTAEPSGEPESVGIPIPDETDTPTPNDKVVFNPDGLPPVDPDSRPPPQDLPPMQQKPRLILKPPPPPEPSP